MFKKISKAVFVLQLCLMPGLRVLAQETISFTLDVEGHLLIKASVNGVEGNFMFDTGAGINLISRNFAQKIGKFEKEDSGFTGFRATGEQMYADIYKGANLRIGSLSDGTPEFAIINSGLGPLDGIISLLPFQDTPFTIDYNDKKIIFETQKSIKQRRAHGRIITLQTDNSRGRSLVFFTWVKINEKLKLQFLIDSGAGSNSFQINSRIIDTLHIDTMGAIKRMHKSEFNPLFVTEMYVAKVAQIDIMGQSALNKKNFKALFIKDFIYDGKMSLNWLGDKLTIDLKKAELIIN